jgi:hypothetical protein
VDVNKREEAKLRFPDMTEGIDYDVVLNSLDKPDDDNIPKWRKDIIDNNLKVCDIYSNIINTIKKGTVEPPY